MKIFVKRSMQSGHQRRLKVYGDSFEIAASSRGYDQSFREACVLPEQHPFGFGERPTTCRCVIVDFPQFANLLTSRLQLERANLDKPELIGLRDTSSDRVYAITEVAFTEGLSKVEEPA
jgi:hypothetical protein